MAWSSNSFNELAKMVMVKETKYFFFLLFWEAVTNLFSTLRDVKVGDKAASITALGLLIAGQKDPLE